MAFKFVDESKVPPAPAPKGSSKAEYFHRLLDELPEDKVAVVPVDAGMSARGIKVSVGRVASSKGLTVTSWDNAEGDKPATEVYVKRTGFKE